MVNFFKFFLLVLIVSCGTPTEYESPDSLDGEENEWFFGDSTQYADTTTIINYIDSTVIVYEDSIILVYQDTTIVHDSVNLIEYTSLKDSTIYKDSVILRDSTLINVIQEVTLNTDGRVVASEIIDLQNTYVLDSGVYFEHTETITIGDTIAAIGFVHPGATCPFDFNINLSVDKQSIYVTATAREVVSYYDVGDFIEIDKNKEVTYFPLNMYRYYEQKLVDCLTEYHEEYGEQYTGILSFDSGDLSYKLGFIHPGDHIPFTFSIDYHNTYYYIYSTLTKDFGFYDKNDSFQEYQTIKY